MSIVTLQQDSVGQLAMQADAVGRLAQDGGAFSPPRSRRSKPMTRPHSLGSFNVSTWFRAAS